MTTSVDAEEFWVWSAFAALPLEGRALNAALADALIEDAELRTPGDTLEVGAGEARLWEAPGLREAALCAGRLVLTDADRPLVGRVANSVHLRSPGIVVEHADVGALPYPTAAFARALAVHVLHWRGTEDAVRQAVVELARVLRDDGTLYVVTVDEAVHMRELYELLNRAAADVREQGLPIRAIIPSASPRVQPFCAGNAEALLRERFELLSVRRFDYAHLVEPLHPSGGSGEDFVVRYARTLPFIREAVSEGALSEPFFEALRAVVRAEFDRAGAFRFSRTDVLYRCSLPRRG